MDCLLMLLFLLWLEPLRSWKLSLHISCSVLLAFLWITCHNEPHLWLAFVLIRVFTTFCILFLACFVQHVGHWVCLTKTLTGDRLEGNRFTFDWLEWRLRSVWAMHIEGRCHLVTISIVTVMYFEGTALCSSVVCHSRPGGDFGTFLVTHPYFDRLSHLLI